MPRALKLGAVAVAGIALALVAAWFAFVAAPSPEQVCQHLIALTERAAQRPGGPPSDTSSPAAQRLAERCVDDKSRRMRLRGKLAYARYARCLVAAQTLDEAEHC